MPDILTEVKRYLQVTWEDETTDQGIRGMMERGKARLQTIAGAPLDFESEGMPKALLLDYCRYANSQALETFERNFEPELLSLRYDYGGLTNGDQDADTV